MTEESVRDRNRASIQLDSGREHSPRDMSSSETGHYYGEIDESETTGTENWGNEECVSTLRIIRELVGVRSAARAYPACLIKFEAVASYQDSSKRGGP
eukprot:gene27375-biopygen10438